MLTITASENGASLFCSFLNHIYLLLLLLSLFWLVFWYNGTKSGESGTSIFCLTVVEIFPKFYWCLTSISLSFKNVCVCVCVCVCVTSEPIGPKMTFSWMPSILDVILVWMTGCVCMHLEKAYRFSLKLQTKTEFQATPWC